jgi:hypothetical protein
MPFTNFRSQPPRQSLVLDQLPLTADAQAHLPCIIMQAIVMTINVVMVPITRNDINAMSRIISQFDSIRTSLPIAVCRSVRRRTVPYLFAATGVNFDTAAGN